MENFESLDFLQVWSLLLAYQNLYENRAQSRANDVSAANDKQAHYLLNELGRKFEEQNQMLREILEELHYARNEGVKGYAQDQGALQADS